MNSDFIGVFDSGVGGISVLKELFKLMPEENYIYFGDSVNAPYGNKTVDEVRSLTVANIEFLVSLGAKAVVIACNTATSAAVNLLRDEFDIPIIGIEPAVKPAVEVGDDQRVLCMATAVTLHEEKFCELISHFKGRAEIIPLVCENLAELVEAGECHSERTREYLKSILTPYVGRIDSVVLGCTHYPFVKDEIAKILGKNVKIFDGGLGTAKETKRKLIEHNIKKCEGISGKIIFLNSQNSKENDELAKMLFEN